MTSWRAAAFQVAAAGAGLMVALGAGFGGPAMAETAGAQRVPAVHPLHPREAPFTVAQALAYPFSNGLAAAARGGAIAWVRNVEGVRNVWFARAPQFTPRQVTAYTEDDGQEITQLTFSPDGSRLLYVRGGDHDANWPAEGGMAPDPAGNPAQPRVEIWQASLAGGEPKRIAEGDAPAISASGRLAFIKDGQVWTAPLDGAAGTAARLFFDRGKDAELTWSPDGSRLAFVSQRDDHAFVGVFEGADKPLRYLAPSTGRDAEPRWSPDGTRLAFVRQPGLGGAPEPILRNLPHPWSIWVASLADGRGQRVWQSPNTLAGSFPDVVGEANLAWAAGDRLVFLAYLTDWPHLYSVPVAGGAALELTPGAFMVEHVALAADGRTVVYDANTGSTRDDGERRHVFRVPVDRAAPEALSRGQGLEWTPVDAGGGTVAALVADPRQPPEAALLDARGVRRLPISADATPARYAGARFVEPRAVTFTAADGVVVHGQLFEREAATPGARRPAVIFVHGGPPRQMLLGWHYFDYYSNAYATNQALAARGFVVLSVNYRLGIGYGRAFQQPEHAGLAGAAEYQDVLAGAHFLQGLTEVDGRRIGIWGGSYGGYLTALALARNSDTFAAGVDLHGVHDWSREFDDWLGKPVTRYEQGDREQALKIAFQSSPVADVAHWRSPVLLIQGDDDRNVRFAQTVDLARRLDAQGVSYEEIVLPNEIHGFLRHASWLRADEATVDFLTRQLRPGEP